LAACSRSEARLTPEVTVAVAVVKNFILRDFVE
jgi:glycerol uptake facilitator-like aquaporin